MNIEIKGISKKYGDKVVFDNFSGVIKEGCVTSLIAPSGGGKTTLLRMIAGIELPDEGMIKGIGDKRISMVFQENRLCEGMSAIANVLLVCGKEITSKKIEQELKEIGLGGTGEQRACGLSGGMKRRVALLRALLADYDILLLDEPFKGLDEELKKEVMHYTLEKSKGKTVLFVTHEEEEIQIMNGEKLFLLR